MKTFAIAPTASRSVLGTMNDFALALSARLRYEPGAELVVVSSWLATTPILVFDGQSPQEMVSALLA